jgi:hypothetical protein
MTVSTDSMPTPMKSTMCMGAPAPGTNPFVPPAQPGQNCSKSSFIKTATGYTVDMECSVNGMTMISKGDVGDDFSSNYKTVIKTKMTGANIPAMMQNERTSTVDAKYLGPCPSGMQPGTMKQG